MRGSTTARFSSKSGSWLPQGIVRATPSTICLLTVLVLGAVVMGGWLFRSAFLVQIVPGFTPMQFNTALCFSASALAFLLLEHGRKRAAGGVGIFVSALSSLTLLQYLSGFDFGIDEFVVEHFLTDQTSHPGRMAPNTAAGFIIAGLAASAMSLLRRPQRAATAGLLLTPVLVGLGGISLLGYATGIEDLLGWSRLTRMALHTSAGFVLLGVGAFALALVTERRSGRSRSLTYIAPAIVLLLSVQIGLWIGLNHYEAERLAAYARTDPDVLRSALPEVVLGIGLLLTGVIGVAIHLMHRNQRIVRLEQVNRELRALNRELDQFAYAASHDLRSPLRGIAALTDWIRDDLGGEASERSERHLRQLSQRIERMQLLLDAMLSYARVSRLSHDVEPVSVPKTVEALTEILEISERFSVRVDARPATIRVDKAVFELVLVNLIGNSVKHHDRDGGVIAVTVREREGQYEISVEDDGEGIDPRFHDRIFDVFQTLRPRDELEAAGMGLAIVLKALASVKAEIRVFSDPSRGRGSRFVIRWPLDGAMPAGQGRAHLVENEKKDEEQ